MSTAGTVARPWLRRLSRSATTPRVRLFCFPFAGGGAGAFRGWADELPEDVELFAVQPPGREDRMFEDVVDDLDTTVDALVGEVLPYTDLPFAFFGHSLGAIVSWEVARRMAERHGIEPDDLLISGCRALPTIHDGRRDLHDLTDPDLVDELRKLNGTPQAILDHPELIGMLLPAIRADYRMLSRYRYSPRSHVGSTVSVFGGDADPAVDLPRLYRWAELVDGELSIRVLPGDHFFLHSARTLLLREVSARLARHTGAAPPHERDMPAVISDTGKYAEFVRQAIVELDDSGQLTLAEVQENSLLIIRLAAEITERFNTSVDIVDLFDAASVEELGQLIAESLVRSA